nr:2-oxo-4-hydroxy-4-carboxy-5-ureidoimidazoline decarboxylase [Acinetobacter sp. Marseille-Q1620]
MYLKEFNQLSASNKKAMLRHCVNISSWVDAITQHEAFNSIEQLLSFAWQQAQSWSWNEIKQSLDLHPRIGERKAHQTLSEKEQAFSDKEQAAIKIDHKTQKALEQGNQAYEKKFGFIFLIKAYGLNAEEILIALNYRLNNDLKTEQKIVHQQLMEIALLRLSKEIQS